MKAGVEFKEDGSPVLYLIVRDSGIGIKDEDKSKVFKMLGKLEATANINTSGVGLGLSTCKKIAEALGGSIFIIEDKIKRNVSDDYNLLENTYRSKNNKSFSKTKE